MYHGKNGKEGIITSDAFLTHRAVRNTIKWFDAFDSELLNSIKSMGFGKIQKQFKEFE